MSRRSGPLWVSVLVAVGFALGAVNFCSPWHPRPRRLGCQRGAIVSQTVSEDTDLLPKSHISGALQRVLGRDVFKSETPFFYRTTGTKSFYYGLLRIPALPKKNPDGSNYIPARPFHYCSGRGRTLEDAEQDAARKALAVIRRADSEVARWLSWSASTSKQALEVLAAELADARETDGKARMRLNRALAVLHGRTIKAHEIRYFTKDDPDSCHVVLRLPWKQNRTYYFEGSGLTSLDAKESAAEAALRILRPMTSKIEAELPWRGKQSERNVTQTPQEAALNKKVPAKIRLYQLLDLAMRRTGRVLHQNDLVYSCRPVVDKDEAENEDVKVWQSATTEVMLRVPPLQPDGDDLTFSKRVPAWRKPPPPDSEHFRNPQKKKQFYDLRAESRRSFLEAQQAVADVAVEELLELLPSDFFEAAAESSEKVMLQS
ncbi:unnamed protein product [Cladocopium goreaui]|uniref:Uncharacterized protein n=1 Tax=Cladocopium goreaui TaxID=2562237 RepID=A0A9P1D1X7_9DINO|nr:unnamed protein product [Cladocopium goreaui]